MRGMIPLFKTGGRIVPGIPRAQSITNSEVFPDSVDVVVIGGGYIGCCTALELIERGLTVALCEKGVIAGEASGRSLGWVDSQFLDPVKMEIIGRSKILWEEMNKRVGNETGYRRHGLVSLLKTDEDVATAQSWLDSVKGADGVDARIVSGEELEALILKSRIHWKAGLFQPSDGSVESLLAAPAIAQGAQDKGVIILQKCAVRGIDTSAGSVSAAVTERGAIKCNAIVLAGGAWSPLFAGSLGIRLPQFQAHSSMIRTKPYDGPEVSAWGSGYSWRKQIDEGYTIATINGAVPITPSTLRYFFRLLPALRVMWNEVDPVFSPSTFFTYLAMPEKWNLDEVTPFEKHRILMPEIRHGLLDDIKKKLVADFPDFANIEEEERWGGILVSTLDNMPVISKAEEIPGLFLGTGFYYGLTMGPAAGEALADLVTGQPPKIDLSLFNHRRFFNKSKLIFRA